jgi:putative transposase
MKEAYAVRRTVPPSAEIEARIEQMLSVGVGESPRESLSELAKLGARLIIQRAVEDEFDAWLGRARYERRPEGQGGRGNEESGLRNGFRPRRLQTGEGELSVEIPQVRQAAETFASKLFPRTPKLLRTEPLKALVIGAFVRGLSMRDVESLCEQAGLGKLSKSTASRMCEELKERFERFRAATSTRSGWSRCSSTRRSSPCAPTGPRRACWSPGGSPKTASACCWR